MDVHVLGPLELSDDGLALHIGSGQQLTFLALLLVNRGTVVTMEEAIDAIWGQMPPSSAENSIHVYVSHLRKALGDSRVVTRGRGYAFLIEHGELDADVFETRLAEGRDRRAAGDAAGASEVLTTALSLWRGRAFADVFYEDFAQREIRRLEELRLTALEERIAADLERGRSTSVVSELEGLVREHPHRERLRGQLMLALYRSGRQADALEVYRLGRESLVEELGLEPDPSLQELERAILRQDPSLLEPRGEEARVGAARGRRHGGSIVLVGAVVLLAAVSAALLRQITADDVGVSVPPNSVAAIDLEEGRVLGDVAGGAAPVAVAVGEGAVWVANSGDQTVTRVDPRTFESSTIGVGGDVSDVAVGFGSVWVANGNDGTLARFDAVTRGRVASPTFRGDALVPQPVFFVAAGAGGVWLTRGNRLLQVDPGTNSIVRSLRIESPLGLAIGRDSVWVTTRSARILRVDAKTGAVRARLSLPSAGVEPVFGGGFLWVVVPSLGDAIWAVNPESGEPTAIAPVGSRDLAWGAGALWSASDGALLQLSKAGHVVRRTSLGQDPAAVAVGHGATWVAVGTTAS